MIELKDTDPSIPFFAQLESPDDGPVTLINTFVAPDGGIDAVIDVWQKDSIVMRQQPGFISAQLYRGTASSRVLTNIAVWESTSALRAAFFNPQFQELLPLYPDGSTSAPVLVRKQAVPGICIG
ncbi:antibiotic biosynthesis monooxygenase family protein [Actinoplanes sp. NPDC020271]|uniref:antibiotic biosynthesis monooxygenase family protein n=1 Tax=Actinoplanes sp. NPDC020271 TaxID=3363896 RepID=UPI0037BBD9B8